MVTLALSADEARLLLRHLSRHLGELDSELVRTDRPALQHDFAREIDVLRAIQTRLADAAGTE